MTADGIFTEDPVHLFTDGISHMEKFPSLKLNAVDKAVISMLEQRHKVAHVKVESL